MKTLIRYTRNIPSISGRTLKIAILYHETIRIKIKLIFITHIYRAELKNLPPRRNADLIGRNHSFILVSKDISHK